jgi:hypothetical protein
MRATLQQRISRFCQITGSAFFRVGRGRAGGPLVLINRARIHTLAVGARLPTIYNSREYVETGGLMSYGPNWPDRWRRAADIVDKIFRGAKPADIPDMKPWADGPTVRAVADDIVRAEFYRSYLAHGATPEAKQAAKQKAYKRATHDAQASGLIGVLNIEGEAVLWLASPKDGPAQNA